MSPQTYLIHTAVENGETRVVYRIAEAEHETVMLDCRTKPGQVARLRYGTIEVSDTEPFAFRTVDIEPSLVSGASVRFDMAGHPFGFYALTIAEAPAEALDPCLLFSWHPKSGSIRMAAFSSGSWPQYVRDLRTEEELNAMEAEFVGRQQLALSEQIGLLEGKIAILSAHVSELDQAQDAKTHELAGYAEQLDVLRAQLSKLTGGAG